MGYKVPVAVVVLVLVLVLVVVLQDFLVVLVVLASSTAMVRQQQVKAILPAQ